MDKEQLNSLKEQILKGGKRLLAEGLVARTWGNISIRVNDTFMLITPSGRPYEELTQEDIVLVNYHTSKYEGNVKPSSEKELHCEIYRTRKKVNAVIHTHQIDRQCLIPMPMRFHIRCVYRLFYRGIAGFAVVVEPLLRVYTLSTVK